MDKKENHYFTNEEKQFILDNLYTMSGPELSKKLGQSVKRIYGFARKRGYKHFLDGKCILRECDLEMFKKLYPITSNSYLSEKYFPYLKPEQMRSVAHRLNIRKTPKQRVRNYTEEQLLDRLKQAVEQHGRTPLLTEVSEWTGIGETTYRNYFGNLNRALELIGVRRIPYNTSHIPHTAPQEAYYAKDGTKCDSISEQKITNILLELNFSFVHDEEYQKYIQNNDFGTMRFDWYLPKYNKFIEFFGMFGGKGHDDYQKKVHKKIELCHKNNVSLIEIYPRQLRYKSLSKFTEWLIQEVNN